MALPRKVLLKKATKFELKALETNNIDMGNLSGLNKVIDDVYALRRPKPIDYYNRTDLIRIFNTIAKEIYGNSDECPVVEGFGSFVMDMFSTVSDLDLSINFGSVEVECPREKKILALNKIYKKLHALQSNGHVTGIQRITTARVPIVKVVDLGTRIECDISVENWDGILKSQLIRIISAIDERFQKLSFMMKTWAKANGINSSKDRTLNSLSIISLVAFHLQTRNPPILPPFSLLLKDGSEPSKVRKNVDDFKNYGKPNQESLGQLFVTLFIKLDSVEKLWQKGLCASLYDASWASKTFDSQCCPLSVEDFTNRSDNVARAVGMNEAKTMFDCIHNSICFIRMFLDGHLAGYRLSELLFGSEDTFLSPVVKLSQNHGFSGPASRSYKNKKRRRHENSPGKRVSKPWQENLSRNGKTSRPTAANFNQHPAPLNPVVSSFGCGSLPPALSTTDLAANWVRLAQQPCLPQNSLVPDMPQFWASGGNTLSWPHSVHQ